VQPLLTHRTLDRHVFIDLHQDMLSGVGRLSGGFPVYGASYLSGPPHAAAVMSALYPDRPEANLVDELQAHDELLGEHGSTLRLVTTVEDFLAEDPRIGVLPHSEGFDLPAIGPEMLEHLWAEHSLRSLALTWNHETAYGFSCYDEGAARLKPQGCELLRGLEDSPLLLDLAHLNDAGFFEALDLYAPPVLVSHSFCRTIVDHPRGLSDDQLRGVGEHGGLVRHVERIASLAGEQALSIGTDWGVTDVGELADPASLVTLLDAVGDAFGAHVAERFAFGNAYEFLCAQLPLAS